MDTFIELQLKTGGIIAISVLLYALFLAKDSFFLRNRIWLLATLSVPWMVPMLAMPVWLKSLLFAPKETVPVNVLAFDNIPVNVITAPAEKGIDWMLVGFTMYALVCSILFVRLLWGYLFIHRLKSKGQSTTYKGYKVVLLNDGTINPFSFFRTIFIPNHLERKENGNMILEHERRHCAQLHSIDISLAEWLLIVQWWNPFAWWLRQLIAQNHEYCVDNAMVQHTEEAKAYQYSLLNLLQGSKRVQLVNNFNQSLTKKRLVMMNKKHTNNIIGWAKGLLVLPLLLATLLAFTNPDETVGEAVETSGINDEQDLRKHFATRIKYPLEARDAGFEGTVTVNFKVDKKGNVGKVNIGSNDKAIQLDKVVVVAYAPSGKPATSTPSTKKEMLNLLELEAKRVVEAMPVVKAKAMKSQLLQIDFEFLLQQKSDDSQSALKLKSLRGDELPNSSIGLLNSQGENITISTKGTKLKLNYDGDDMPLFTLDKDVITAEEVEQLKVDDLGRISTLTTEQLKRNGREDWKNGVFAIYTKEAQAKFEAQKPIYIVDGKEFTGDINNISPDDIVEMNVLKGSSAIEKYGDKAKDGAIEITTKAALKQKGDHKANSKAEANTVSISGSSKATPMFIVDGEKRNISNMSADEVDVVTVLKDPELTQVYGEGAENGVILVTSKDNKDEKVLFKTPEDTQISISDFGVTNGKGESPLFIIDGTMQKEAKINADDIERVSVIKGKQAIEKYGEDAKNGAVLIDTKSDKLAEEVVVVGYGTMEKSNDNNPLLVRQGSKAENVRIKGFSGDNKPYVILDGEEYDGSLEDMDHEKIESITVLKDGSAKALYGDKAEHGVIVITSKIE